MGKVLCAIALSLAATPFALSQSSTPHSAATARDQVNADAPLTWTDPATGLTWSKKDNGSDVNWNQASEYCSTLQLAGFRGWRLPTIEELQGIYDPNARVQSVFGNGFTLNVHVMGNLKLTGWHWSSSQEDAAGQRNKVARTFNFGGENPRGTLPLPFNYSMRALCVRSTGD